MKKEQVLERFTELYRKYVEERESQSKPRLRLPSELIESFRQCQSAGLSFEAIAATTGMRKTQFSVLRKKIRAKRFKKLKVEASPEKSSESYFLKGRAGVELHGFRDFPSALEAFRRL